MKPPELSVIIPQALCDPRSDYQFVEMWTRRQQCSPSRYQVIVAMNEGDPAGQEQVRRYLRPQDQLIVQRGKTRMHYYQIGAEAASGRILMLTEDHTFPDENCIDETIAFFEGTRHQAAFMRTKHINRDYFTRQEARLYEQYLEELWKQPDAWNLVRLRAFAIERELYFQVDGLPWQYGLFCEELLSARLAQRKIKIGYADKAVIAHVNTNYPVLWFDVSDYVEGECLFRDTEHCEELRHYFGEPAPWLNRAINVKGVRAKMLSALARTMASEAVTRPGQASSFVFRCWCRLIRLTLASMLGPKLTAERAWFSIQWYRLLSWLWQGHPTRGIDAYEKMWSMMGHLTRLRYYAKLPVPEGIALPNSFDFHSAGPLQLIGFHARESYQGKDFRWTEPVAAIRLNLAADDYRLALDTGMVRGEKCEFIFGFFFNGKKIPRRKMEFADGKISMPIQPEWFVNGEQTIVIVASPIKTPKEEKRQLGLPVFSLEFEAMPQSGSSNQSQAA